MVEGRAFRWSVPSTLDYLDRGHCFQILSNIPKTLDALKTSDDYGASVVTHYTDRSGFLVAVPMDSAANVLLETKRAKYVHSDVYLSDPRLDHVGHFARYPKLGVVVVHCGGPLPVLRSRLSGLGASLGFPNPVGLTSSDIKEQLRRSYKTMEPNRQDIMRYQGLDRSQIAATGCTVLATFPTIVADSNSAEFHGY
ncbi:hypothetical protein F5Y18DRAFT_418136 [Xylariaceae sp. FL1019]|nr:hypothetical protein F5Y18DRAFT_418136 [Xylariaceae sp. FL1019]